MEMEHSQTLQSSILAGVGRSLYLLTTLSKWPEVPEPDSLLVFLC